MEVTVFVYEKYGIEKQTKLGLVNPIELMFMCIVHKACKYNKMSTFGIFKVQNIEQKSFRWTPSPQESRWVYVVLRLFQKYLIQLFQYIEDG